MKPTADELEAIAKALWDSLPGPGMGKPWEQATRAEADAFYASAGDYYRIIAPLVMERAAKELEDENDDGGCYFAERIRALAKP